MHDRAQTEEHERSSDLEAADGRHHFHSLYLNNLRQRQKRQRDRINVEHWPSIKGKMTEVSNIFLS